MRHPWSLVALLALATVACTARPAAQTGVDAARDVAKKVSAKATPAPRASAAADLPATAPAGAQHGLAGITAALFDASAARELLRAQGVTRLVSNNGGNLISDKSGGLVSKIRTGVVADNGGQLISDKSGGLVSNNGGSVVGQNGAGVVGQEAAGLASGQPAGTGAYVLLQTASGSPAPAGTPELYREILHLDPPFQYISTFYKPNFQGEILGFMLADYEARGRQATVVERYVWDDVPFTALDTPSEGLFDVRATFPMRVELSRRTSFTKKIDLVIDMAIKAVEPIILTAFKSMKVDFEMAVPSRAGGSDLLVLHAHDFVYPAGKGPGEMPDGHYPTPTGFQAEGENAQGKLEVKATTPEGGVVTAALSSTYTRADGSRTRTTLTTYADGRREERTEDVGGLEAQLRFAADGTGEGELRDPASGKAVGRLRWDASGVGTISVDGSPEAAIKLY